MQLIRSLGGSELISDLEQSCTLWLSVKVIREDNAPAACAAAWIPLGEGDEGRGKTSTSSGKLRKVASPLRQRAATSYALAAMSGLG